MTLTTNKMRRKAQSTFEIAIFTVVLVAALVATSAFFRRSIQGNWKSSADSFSDVQYNPPSGQDLYGDRGESGVYTEVAFESPIVKIDLLNGGNVLNKNMGEGGSASRDSISWGRDAALIKK